MYHFLQIKAFSPKIFKTAVAAHQLCSIQFMVYNNKETIFFLIFYRAEDCLECRVSKTYKPNLSIDQLDWWFRNARKNHLVTGHASDMPSKEHFCDCVDDSV